MQPKGDYSGWAIAAFTAIGLVASAAWVSVYMPIQALTVDVAVMKGQLHELVSASSMGDKAGGSSQTLAGGK